MLGTSIGRLADSSSLTHTNGSSQRSARFSFPPAAHDLCASRLTSPPITNAAPSSIASLIRY